MSGRLAVGFCLLAGSVWFSYLSMGQTSTARISGVITDESRAVLTGAQIVVRNSSTGVARTVASDERGRYIAPELVPGPYEITVTMTGFETLVRTGITLSVGQDTAINLSMKVGAVAEQVTVTGEAPLVDTSNSSVSGVVEQKRITELPLNGRDFSQLALVQPSVAPIRTTATGSAFGFGTRISLAGSRPMDTGWQLDGTNVNSVTDLGTPGSASGLMMGVDAIREFRVVTGGGYSAELGGYSGGIIQMVTKSGTNSFHGSAYEYLRNDNIDASTWQNNRAGALKPEFRRNQFGGSLGGPIKKNKLFVFGNYEGLRQATSGSSLIDLVPDENVHKGLIPTQGGGLQQVNIAPEVKPYLDLYPLPNGPIQGSGVGERFTPVANVTTQNFVVARADYYLNSNQTIFTRVTLDQASSSVPGLIGVTSNVISTDARYAIVQYEHILSPSLLSTSRAAFNRGNVSPNLKIAIDVPKNLYFLGHDYPPTVGYTGVTPITFDATSTSTRAQNLWDFSQAFSWTRGTHAIKFGGGFQKFGTNNSGPSAGAFGLFQWSSAQNFLQDANMETFTVEVPGSSTTRTLRQRVGNFYFQDDWQVRRNFTVNVGLRYEPWSAPSEKWGRVATIKNFLAATQFDTPLTTGTKTLFNSPGGKSFSPRVGLAWDVKGDGKTAVRAGFGIFNVMLLGNYLQSVSRKNPPYSATLNVSPSNFNLAAASGNTLAIAPSILTSKLNPSTSSEIIQWNLNQPYEMKFNLSVEREIATNLSVNLGYLGSRGTHLTMKQDANAAPPILVNGRPFVANGTPRPNPNNGGITFSASDAKSFYNAMLVEVKKRFARSFQLQGSYTWSKSVDDATTGLGNADFAEGVLSQPFNPKADRGLSALYLGQNLVINGLWSIPSPVHTGFVSYILDGWRLSGIFSATSGSPFSMNISGRNAPDLSRAAGGQRTDVVAGRNSGNITSGTTAGCTFVNGVPGPISPTGTSANTIPAGLKLGTPQLYFDPCAFSLPPAGFYGSLGRNTILGPGFTNLDFSFTKVTPIRITEGSSLQFQVDFFNLLNHPNFGKPAHSLLNAANRNNPLVNGAGQITTTVGSERQIQVGLKLIF